MMKANQLKEMKELTNGELNIKLKNLKEELFHLRFQHATNQLENPNKLVAVRKDIARVKTILREKELSAGA